MITRLHFATLVTFSSIFVTGLAHGQSFTPIRINAGAGAFTDAEGNSWAGDSGYNTGALSSYYGAIGNTPDAVLFQSLRWDTTTAPELRYSFSVSAIPS